MSKYILEKNKLLKLDLFDCIEFGHEYQIILKKFDINSTEEKFINIHYLETARHYISSDYDTCDNYCLNPSYEKYLKIMESLKSDFIGFLNQDEIKIFDLYENYKNLFSKELILLDEVDESDYFEYCKSITE